MHEEVRVLQLVRLKGRPTQEDIAQSAGIAPGVALDGLLDAGHVQKAGERFRLTTDGRARLESLLKAERSEIDQHQLTELYNEFDEFNTEFKQLITDWQLIDDNTPNNHSDPEYDNKIVHRLADLHERFMPLLHRIVDIAPRLAFYPERFSGAVHKVAVAGDHGWLAKPLADSYHTVWFELHEDLIGMAGLSRIKEAAAGRAE